MSTEHSADPEIVGQTKQQIRNLVREIAQLSKSELSPVEFYDQLLNRIVSALAANGGAVWLIGEQGNLELEYQINLRDTRLAESQDDQVRHGRLLRRVLTSGEGMLAQPHSGTLDGDEAEGNPTDFLLVLGPLKTDTESRGLVEVFQRPGGSPTVQRGYLRFLLQMCEFASDFLKTRQLRSLLDQFTRVAAHRNMDQHELASFIANEGCRLLGCDRVSVAIKKGGRCPIEAISGQDTFDKRSTTVMRLGRLATAVVATGETLWSASDTLMMAPQVLEAVEDYLKEDYSKGVAIVPLKELYHPTYPYAGPRVLGALIVEWTDDSRPNQSLIQAISNTSTIALANVLDHNRGSSFWTALSGGLFAVSRGVRSLVDLILHPRIRFGPSAEINESSLSAQAALERQVESIRKLSDNLSMLLQETRSQIRQADSTAKKGTADDIVALLTAADEDVVNKVVRRLAALTSIEIPLLSLIDPKDAVVLETFEGFFDATEGDIAFVTMESPHGERLIGQYSAKGLAAKGIFEGDRFLCRTVQVGDKVQVDLDPLPSLILTAEDERVIDQEIEDILDRGLIYGDE